MQHRRVVLRSRQQQGRCCSIISTTTRLRRFVRESSTKVLSRGQIGGHDGGRIGQDRHAWKCEKSQHAQAKPSLLFVRNRQGVVM